MPPATEATSRPIRLVSKYSGLQVRVKPGKADRIPGTDRYETSSGSWIEFRNHQAVVLLKRAVTLWGSREKGVEWLMAHPRYGVDFWINDDKDTARAKPAASVVTASE